MDIREERILFFHQLGLAIAAWASVETGLWEIIRDRCAKDDRAALWFAFFAIENFRSKMAFADALLCKKVRNEQHLAEWAVLAKRLNKAVRLRNRLAHNRVFEYGFSAIGRRLALIEWPNDKPRTLSRQAPSEALCLRDIAGLTQDFDLLFRSLLNFHSRLAGEKALLPESRERASNPPTIREIRILIREELGLPPLPLRRKSSAP